VCVCVCVCVRQGQAVCSVFVLLAVGRAQLTVCVRVCVWRQAHVFERERILCAGGLFFSF